MRTQWELLQIPFMCFGSMNLIFELVLIPLKPYFSNWFNIVPVPLVFSVGSQKGPIFCFFFSSQYHCFIKYSIRREIDRLYRILSSNITKFTNLICKLVSCYKLWRTLPIWISLDTGFVNMEKLCELPCEITRGCMGNLVTGLRQIETQFEIAKGYKSY